MALKRKRRSHPSDAPLAELYAESGSQGGPISFEESAPLNESTKPEVTMDNHENENLKNKAIETAENAAERAGINKEQIRGTAREWAGKAERTFGQVKAKANQAADELSDRYGEISEQASESWDNALELVRENPGTAIGISLLVGAGVGALIAYLARE